MYYISKYLSKSIGRKKLNLLHANAAGGSLIENILTDILLEGVLDTLKLIPFLFLTYLLMEFIEHKAEDKAERFMKKAGHFAPLLGGALGAVPQCGFSAAASGLFAGRVISIGTLVAVFLSTSDEMLPILLGGDVPPLTVLLIVAYKAGVGIIVGFTVDLLLRLFKKEEKNINIDEICDNDNCHCEKGIFYSAIHHTLTITLFVFLITLLINALVFFIGRESLGAVMYDKPFIGHLIAAVFGLIPNCAASVVLSGLCSEGLITVGTMMAGLFSGAGVGLLVLFRVNRHLKENFLVVGIIIAAGVVFGMLGDLIFPASMMIG